MQLIIPLTCRNLSIPLFEFNAKVDSELIPAFVFQREALTTKLAMQPEHPLVYVLREGDIHLVSSQYRFFIDKRLVSIFANFSL